MDASWPANRSSVRERVGPPSLATRAMGGNLRVASERRLKAPPGFEPRMEVLQIQRGRAPCCLVLVSGLSSSPVCPC